MELFTEKRKCCGCGACAAVCPHTAITMKRDREGFAYPVCDAALCGTCGLCQNVCPMKRAPEAAGGSVYLGAMAREDSLRHGSSSGGIFPLLAQEVFRRGGAVYGAAYGEGLSVAHREALCMESLEALRKTKYVQSAMDGVYIRVRNRLERGQWALFCGTPCQAQALRLYLGRDYPTLLLAGLVCYGTPSPGIWEDYVKSLEKRHGARLTNFSFRDKRARDSGRTRAYTAGGQEYCAPLGEDLFCRMYFRNYTLRPCCHSCKFCTPDRNFDFTLGDFWGAEKVCPQAVDGMGLSLVILHSQKAQAFWKSLEAGAVRFPCAREDILQPRLCSPTPAAKNRRLFMRARRLGLERAARFVGFVERLQAKR